MSIKAGDPVYLKRGTDGQLVAYPFSKNPKAGEAMILARDYRGELVAGTVGKPMSGDPVVIVRDARAESVAVLMTGKHGNCLDCDPSLEATLTISGFTGECSWVNDAWPLIGLKYPDDYSHPEWYPGVCPWVEYVHSVPWPPEFGGWGTYALVSPGGANSEVGIYIAGMYEFYWIVATDQTLVCQDGKPTGSGTLQGPYSIFPYNNCGNQSGPYSLGCTGIHEVLACDRHVHCAFCKNLDNLPEAEQWKAKLESKYGKWSCPYDNAPCAGAEPEAADWCKRFGIPTGPTACKLCSESTGEDRARMLQEKLAAGIEYRKKVCKLRTQINGETEERKCCGGKVNQVPVFRCSDTGKRAKCSECRRKQI